MKPKTEELLYYMLFWCERLMRPRYRILTQSFESWAHQNGFLTRLHELERMQFVEKLESETDRQLYRLTELGRLHALGGRDPSDCWAEPWNGQWTWASYDVPVNRRLIRDNTRCFLREQGFGQLQKSVWISPRPLALNLQKRLKKRVHARSLVVMQGRPCSGETDQDLVAAAWDFESINTSYARYLQVLKTRPRDQVQDKSSAQAFQAWVQEERTAWCLAVERDPLLPEPLWPRGYQGPICWQAKMKSLAAAASQIRPFKP